MFSGAGASQSPQRAAPAVDRELQPLLRMAPDDATGRQADLLARLYRGRVHAPLAAAALPDGVAAEDLLITERIVAEQLRPGDLLAVRTSGDPAPYVADPVSLRRFARLESCGEDCTLVVTTSVHGVPAETVRWRAVTGRLVYAMNRRTAELRELRDPTAPRPVTLAAAYNAWRPRWTADAVGARLDELRRPTQRAPRPILTLDVLEPAQSGSRPALLDGAP